MQYVQTPILSSPQLQALLGSSDLRIVDVRPKGADGAPPYLSGHIPGALYLDLATDLSGPTGPGRHPLPSPTTFAKTLSAGGIGDTSKVVCYDAGGGAIAARLWWMLDTLGLDTVAVLDGGFGTWCAAGLPTTQEETPYTPALWTLAENRNPTVDREELSDGAKRYCVLDARAAERYLGEVEPLDAIAGHIPGARSAPYAENLRDGLFRPPEELSDRFSAIIPDDGRELVHSCGSGVTACHNILAMRIAGFGRTALYPGSWSDWSSSGCPVETGA